MNILMVLSTKKFPPDGRVEREARDLLREGHTLFLMARRGPSQRPRETVDGVHVLRTWLPFQKTKPLADLIYFFCQRYLILFPILLACRRHRIDALHVHDLPYAFATTLAGRLLKLPVIFDMHEHYVAMLTSSFQAAAYRPFRPFAFILLGLLRAEERFACRRAHTVIVVAKEHRPRIESLGTPAHRLLEITNTEDTDAFTALPPDPAVESAFPDDFRVLYVGGFGPHRGLQPVLRAIALVRDELPNIRLLLVGDGADRPELEALTDELHLRDHVTFTGFEPFAKLPSYIRNAHVCLVPHVSTPHVDTTMPNKIFQYMILARPVLVTDVAPLRRIVEDARCGLVFHQHDPQAIADAILQLRDPDLRQRLGDNGRAAVHDRYNWQSTVRPLLALYRNLAATAAARSQNATTTKE